MESWVIGHDQLHLKFCKGQGGAFGDILIDEKDDGGILAALESVELLDTARGFGTGHVVWAEEDEAEEVVASGGAAWETEGHVVGFKICFLVLISTSRDGNDMGDQPLHRECGPWDSRSRVTAGFQRSLRRRLELKRFIEMPNGSIVGAGHLLG